MGSALLGGLLRAGWAAPGECAVLERRPEARSALAARFAGVAVVEAPVAAEAAVLAVKPDDARGACALVRSGGYRRVLSVVAGVRLATLEAWLGPQTAVVRAMPNTPALVGASASVVAGGSAATEEDLAWAEEVLSAIGVVVRLDERLVDAATGLSGSGPAYLFLVAEALIDAGVLAGLDRDVARTLALQTILGAGRLLTESGESPEALRAAVTSPGGTTAAALRVLEERSVRSAFLEAVLAAARRAEELGGAG
jgi:pyrroline-5-carboxylate reductase